MTRIPMAIGVGAAACVALSAAGSPASTSPLKRNGVIAFVSNRLPDSGGEIYAVTAAGQRRRDLSRSLGPDSDPVVSPAGRRIAFISFRGGRSALYVRQVDGAGLRRIAVVRGYPADGGGGVTWSPNGRRIAFHDGTGARVVSSRGGPVRNLGGGIFPSWSADGTRIAYVVARREGQNRVVVVRPTGRHLWSARGTSPRWSPRGARLAYTSVGAPEMIRTTITNQAGRRLARFLGWFQSWSPDGRRLAFWRGRNYTLYVADWNGRHARRLASNTYTAAWSPASDRLAVGGNFGSRVYDLRDRGGWHRLSGLVTVVAWSPSSTRIVLRGEYPLYTVRPSGKGLRLVARPPAGSNISTVSWARNGRMLVYRQQSEISGELFTIQPESRKIRRLTRNGYDKNMPAWSPDGREIAFSEASVLGRCHGCSYNIAVVDARGVEMNVIEGDFAFQPTWSPDGQRIAFEEDSEGPLIRVYNGDIEPVTVAPGGQPAWSPDGQRIAFTAIRGGLATMKPDGSDIRQVIDGPADAPVWSPDGTLIAFLRRGKIWAVHPNGTDLHQLIETSAQSFDWSPDGRSLVLSKGGDLFIVGASGTGLRRLTSGLPRDVSPTWQPLP
jgi:Tol biopolymer transport system component